MADACEIDNGKDSRGLKVNDDLPTPEELRAAEGLEVLDSKKAAHSFKSLYSGPDSPRRVMVIFFRHFFCGGCTRYVQALAASATPEKLKAIDTGIVWIGCGDAGLIDMYIGDTGCPHPIYADASLKLFDAMGMVKVMDNGTPNNYVPQSVLQLFFEGMGKAVPRLLGSLFTGLPITKSGRPDQQGGEFLFEGDGEDKKVTWCHRMRDGRDHTDPDEMLKILGVEK